MSSPRRLILVALLIAISSPSFFAQTTAKNAGNGLWRDVEERTLVRSLTSASGSASLRRDIVPQAYRTVALDKAGLTNTLSLVLPEASGPIGITGTEFQIPLPSGGYGRFLIQESPVMDEKLAARFPEVKTYVGQGLDDPTATMRMDVTPRGFHAIILSPKGDIYIDPYSRETDTNYISYFKKDFVADKPFSCLTETKAGRNVARSKSGTPLRPTGATLRSYRLALACTVEYAAAVCAPNAPTLANTLAAMVTSINRCSAIYERDFAIRFTLIGNDDRLIYLSGADPYSNGDGGSMLGENQANIDSVIGNANYDFGHVFSTGGGGVAYGSVVCMNGSKALGVTGSPNPVGDPYDVDYVVHEMGHQFGGNHPFNGNSGSCTAGNRNGATAYEPGSGTTIMAYAGICAPQNLAPNSDDYFHTVNYDEIDSFTLGGGASCAQTTATGNTPPAISAVPVHTIPMQTPFSLTAAATDVDGDTLTCCWEEFDLGVAQNPTAAPRDNGSSPIFRSFAPTTNPTRTFPSLTYILSNANVPPPSVGGLATGEFLPITSRTMTYRCTVRDNHAGGGGSNYISTTVISTTAAGPFVITAPNATATFAGGAQTTVTWNVANTTVAPVSCANVKISFSSAGGNTFPNVLAASVTNNGSALVTLPNIATTQGRVKVEAVGNIFFDISDANLTITSTNTAPTVNITNGITVVRGTAAATVATVGTASDGEGDPLIVEVSDVPYGATVTPGIASGNISLSVLADCRLTTTLLTRTYPITLTVIDSNGARTSSLVNLVIAPNPAPTVGTYPDVTVVPNSTVNSTPAALAADSNGNLPVSPFSVYPTTLPGGGTISVNQLTGLVTAAASNSATLGVMSVRVTVLDTCGAAAVRIFNVTVSSTTSLANYLGGYGLSGGNAAPGFDYDGDGLVNLLEYALNLNPTIASQAGLPVVTLKDYGGTLYLSMTFTRSSAATDLTYVAQGSSDLVNWSALGTSTAGGAMSGAGVVSDVGPAPFFAVEVRDTVPFSGAPGSQRFLRLQVTSP